MEKPPKLSGFGGLLRLMKILFTADWHIKLGQKNVPKEWAINRYRMFFDKIGELEKEVDFHIISGDLFDRLPTLPELELYFEFVSRCTIETIITTGNHESETKKKSFFEYLKQVTNRLNPLVTVELNRVRPTEDSCIVPYEFIKDKATWDNLDAKVVFTHVRGEIPPHVKPEIPLEWLEKFDKVFAGDLHSHQNTQGNIVYPGSPMTTSFHRNETKGSNGYLIINSDDWSYVWKDFELPQLIRKTVQDKSEMVPTDYHHTIYELEGSMEDLSSVKNSELLDKKVIKRASDVELILTDDMGIEKELEEYLIYILELDNIDKVMTAFHEYD